MQIIRLVRRLAWPVGVVVFCGVGGALAQGTSDDAVRQACTPDAMRLCGDTIPDVAKTTACMHAKRAQLSSECRTAMAAGSGGGGHRTYHHYRHHAAH